MRTLIFALAVSLFTGTVMAQTDSIVIPESETLNLHDLEVEAMVRSPEIERAGTQSDLQIAQTHALGTLPPPEFHYMEENMEGFDPSTSMFRRLELTQTIPFPTKLLADKEIGDIRAAHADHDRLERIGDVLRRLRTAYIELWYAQQMDVLENQNARRLREISEAVFARLRLGTASQQEALSVDLELAAAENRLFTVNQMERSAKAMLMSILNRRPADTLGYAVIPEEITFNLSLDTLLDYAHRFRPMVLHDSLGIEQSRVEASRARKSLFPDLMLGVQRVTSPSTGFQGWSASIGITLPFAPWSLGESQAEREAADARLRDADAAYHSTLRMVESNVADAFARASASYNQVRNFQATILPRVRQMLASSISDYRFGRLDFTGLLGSYKMEVEQFKDFYMARMNFEDAVIALEHETGIDIQ